MADELFWAEFWLKVGFAIFLIIGGSIFIRRGVLETEMKSRRHIKYGIAMFALLTSLTRIFFLFSDFQLEDSLAYNIFWRSAVISSMLALVFIIILIETYLLKTYYICTAIGIVGIVAILIVDIPIVQLLNIPLYIILGGEILLLYLYIAIKSAGTSLRTKSLLMILSLVIFSAGILFDSESFTSVAFGTDLGLVGTILMWVGLGWYLKLNYQD